MEVFKFGFRQWKKHLPLDILTKLLSFTALTADLLLPLITAMFINHVIKEEAPEEGQRPEEPHTVHFPVFSGK